MSDIEQLSLLLDETGPIRKRPVEPIIRDAVVEGEYRFLAQRAWGSGPRVLWAMTNPSLADGNRDDPTMWRVMEFSYRWGFGSAVVVNVYPFVAPNMKLLKFWRTKRSNASSIDPFNLDPCGAQRKNDAIVRAQMNAAQLYIAAWGNDIDRADLELFLRKARPTVDTSEHDGFGDLPFPIDWYSLGTNKDGSPRHPLARGQNRVPDDQQPILWRKGIG
jgi:hypothetical protein